jgi:hypothetical protein
MILSFYAFLKAYILVHHHFLYTFIWIFNRILSWPIMQRGLVLYLFLGIFWFVLNRYIMMRRIVHWYWLILISVWILNRLILIINRGFLHWSVRFLNLTVFLNRIINSLVILNCVLNGLVIVLVISTSLNWSIHKFINIALNWFVRMLEDCWKIGVIVIDSSRLKCWKIYFIKSFLVY